MGLYFFKPPKAKIERVFIMGVKITSPNLNDFLFPTSKEGLIIESLLKLRFFNSSSTGPLFFK